MRPGGAPGGGGVGRPGWPWKVRLGGFLPAEPQGLAGAHCGSLLMERY